MIQSNRMSPSFVLRSQTPPFQQDEFPDDNHYTDISQQSDAQKLKGFIMHPHKHNEKQTDYLTLKIFPSSIENIWQKNYLIILYFVARFIYLMKLRSRSIKMQYVNKRIFGMIGDQSSDFQYYIDKKWINQKSKLKDKLKTWLLKCRVIQNSFNYFNDFIKKIKVFDPDSYLRLIWQIIVALILVYSLFYSTFYFSFPNVDNDENLIYQFTFLFSSTIFSIDILININSAYYKNGQIYSERLSIFKHYAKSSLWQDIFILIFNAFYKQNILYALFLIYLMLRKIIGLVDFIENELNLRETKAAHVDLAKLIFTIFYTCHFFGCGFRSLASYEISIGQHNNWLNEYHYYDKSYTEQYIASIYWSTITALTIGYGDLVPQNYIEQTYCILFNLFASMLFGYSISQIGEIFRIIKQKNNEIRDKMIKINSYLKHKKIEQNLQLQIRKYFEYFYRLKAQENALDQSEFQYLNQDLKQKFYLNLFQKWLQSSKLIGNDFSENCLQQLCFQMKETRCAPDEIIVEQGKVNNKIIFLVDGQMEIYCQPNEKNFIHLNLLQQGSVLADTDLFVPSVKEYTSRSRGFSTIVYLSHEDFLNTIKHYNVDYQKMMMKKNLISENKHLNAFSISCKVCNGAHILQNCPFIFEQFPKDKIIREFNTTQDQQRKKLKKSYIRRAKYHSLINIMNYQDECLQFLFKNSELIDIDLDDLKISDLIGSIPPVEVNSQKNISSNEAKHKDSEIQSFQSIEQICTKSQVAQKLNDMKRSLSNQNALGSEIMNSSIGDSNKQVQGKNLVQRASIINFQNSYKSIQKLKETQKVISFKNIELIRDCNLQRKGVIQQNYIEEFECVGEFDFFCADQNLSNVIRNLKQVNRKEKQKKSLNIKKFQFDRVNLDEL